MFLPLQNRAFIYNEWTGKNYVNNVCFQRGINDVFILHLANSSCFCGVISTKNPNYACCSLKIWCLVSGLLSGWLAKFQKKIFLICDVIYCSSQSGLVSSRTLVCAREMEVKKWRRTVGRAENLSPPKKWTDTWVWVLQ